MSESTEPEKLVTDSKGNYLVRASSGKGYTAFNKNDVCIGGFEAADDKEASNKFISGKLNESSVDYVKWVQLPDGKWKMWGSNDGPELDPNFLERAKKQNNTEYKDAKVAKNGEYPEGVDENDIWDKHKFSESLNEESWDKDRVSELVNYYLDRSDMPINTLVNKIVTQMKDEGRKLPWNTTDLYDFIYIIIF